MSLRTVAMHRRRRTQRTTSPRAGAGLVLLVVLLALGAMSIAGTALYRSVETAQAVAGRLAMRQAALAAADLAIDDAVARLFERGEAGSLEADAPAFAYRATTQPPAPALPVPAALIDDAALAAGPSPLAAGDYRLHRLVERMCEDEGAPTPARCTMLPPESTLTAAGGASTPPRRWPLYRITVRIDGPAGTRAFVQAMLSERDGQRRVQWRALAE